MTKYTLVFACVLVICTYKIATANGNPAEQNPTAGANVGQGLTNKAATTTPGANKGNEESEEESEESDEQPKKDGKPSIGVQNPVQTSTTNSAAKPATTGSTQAVNKGKEESEEESEESDEEPKKDGTPSTRVQNPSQISTTNSASKPATTGNTPGVNKGEEESEEESEEQPKKDIKPSTGVQSPVQTSTTNSATKPATAGSTQAVSKGKEESEEESESDEQQNKDGKPSTGVQKPVQTSTDPAQVALLATPNSGGTKDAVDSPTNINNVRKTDKAAKYSNTKSSASQTKLRREDVEKEAEDYSDDASDDTSYVYYKDDKTHRAKNKHKYARPIVYYADDSESYTGQKKEHGHSKSPANSIRRRYQRKPITINIPIRIY